MAPCPFCQRIASGNYDDASWISTVSFEPLDPVVPGHRLFIPREHFANVSENPELSGQVFANAAAHAAKLGGACST